MGTSFESSLRLACSRQFAEASGRHGGCESLDQSLVCSLTFGLHRNDVLLRLIAIRVRVYQKRSMLSFKL